MIAGEVRRYLRDNAPIRVSRSIRDVAYRVLQCKEAMVAKMDREPTLEEIARELDERRTDLMMLFNRQFYLSPDQADLAAMLLICGLKEESLDKLICTKVTVAI